MKYIMSVFFLILVSINSSVLSFTIENQFQHFTTEQGLSSSNVTGIIQDDQGFIWIGTDNGLNTYDGYNFNVYKKIANDSSSLVHNQITLLYLDSQKRLWIGTVWGLSLYNRQKNNFVNNFTFNNLETRKNVKSIIEDKNFNLLLISDDGLIFKFDEQSRNFRQMYDLNMMIMSFAIDQNNDFWIGNLDGLHHLNIKDMTFTLYQHKPDDDNSISNNIVMSLLQDRDRLWVGTAGNGLNLYNSNTNSFKRLFINKTNIYFIYRDDQGIIWFGTSQGLIQYNEQTGRYHEYLHDSKDQTSLSSEGASCCIKDRQTNLWVGTKFGGVNFSSKNKAFNFLNLKSSPPLTKNNISSLFIDKKGNLWAGSFNEGIDVISRVRGTKINYEPDSRNSFSIGKGTVHTIFQDSRGVIWVSTFEGGLQYYDEKTGRFKSVDIISANNQSVLSRDIRSIAEDKHNNLWLATHGAGLCKYDYYAKKTTFYQFDQNNIENSLANNWLFKIIIDSKEQLWIATANGLTLMTPDEKMTSFRNISHNENSLSNDAVYTLYEDCRQRIWVGTAEGLNLFNPQSKSFTRIMEKDGLASDYIYGILGDENGNLWLSTSNCLIKYNHDTQVIRNYDYRDGLLSNEFLINSCFKNHDGELLFGGVNGIVTFNPDSLHDNPHAPSVHLVDFKIFNKSVPIGNNPKQDILTAHIDQTRKIHLQHDQNMITLQFVALNYISPGKNQYAYKLEGLDKDWNFVVSKREANYTNLDPGEYTFKVKASNNDGIWNETGVGVKIKIFPPFWETPWFQIAGAVMLLAGIWFFYRIRTYHIHQRNRSLEVKIQEHTLELQIANSSLKKEMDERLDAEKNLLATNQRLQILQQVTAAVHESLDPNKIFHDITDVIVNKMGYSSAILLTLDENGQCYKAMSLSSSKKILNGFNNIFGQDLHNITFPVDKVTNWYKKTINNRELVINKNLEEIAFPLLDKHICQLFNNLGGNQNFILIPLVKNRELMGGLVMSSSRQAIPEEDTKMLQVYANTALQAIINANLYLQTDLAREEVRKSEEKFRTLTENITMGVYRRTSGNRGKIIEANPALVKMFNFNSKEEFLAANFNKLFQNQSERKVLNKKLLQHGMIRHEQINFKKQDGSPFIGSISTVVVKDDAGKIKYYDGIIEDITERIQAAETLEKERTLQRTLIDNLPCGVFVKNKNYQKIIVNPVHIEEVKNRLKSLKINPDVNLLDKTDFDVFPQELAARFFTEDQKVIKDGEIILNKEEYGVKEDGSKVCLLVSKVPLRDKDGTIIGIVGITNDITDHQVAAETIEKERTLLRTLIDNLPGGVFVKDKNYRKIIVNPIHVDGVKGHLQFLGMNSNIDLLGKNDFEVFPQDLAEKFSKEDQKVVEHGQLILNQEEFGVDAKGEEVCLSVSKVPLRDQGGSITGMVGITVDISEQKRAQQQIQKDLMEKQVLIRELYHRTKNNMQVISSMLRLHSKRVKNQQVTTILNEIENKILSMALVHQKLYESRDLSHLNLKDYFNSLVSLLRMIHSNSSTNINFIVEGEEINVLIDTAIPCGLIINELLTNSIKYAFPDKKDGTITISLKIDEKNQLLIKVADNGIGLPVSFDFDQDCNLGLESVIGLVRHQLQGEVSFVNKDGLTCNICLKEQSYKPKNIS